jgi:hypothetical protein
MPSQTEAQQRAEFLLSEANGLRSRENAVFTGANFPVGRIVARASIGTVTTGASGTGNGAFAATPVVSPGTQEGVYTLEIFEAVGNAGRFEVRAPDGDVIGLGNVGVAFDKGGISFTLLDGTTDFVVGDRRTITVAGGSDKIVNFDADGTGGAEVVVGVAYDTYDASSADVKGVIIARDAEVRLADLSAAAGGDLAAGIAGLAVLGIIARS